MAAYFDRLDELLAETAPVLSELVGRIRMEYAVDDWCFERYSCPRFTTPDAEGSVILDYGISVEA